MLERTFKSGSGPAFASINPATGETVWEGASGTPQDCAAALAAARQAFPGWADRTLADRIAVARRYAAILKQRSEAIAADISRETGKPLWETKIEAASMAAKVEVSIAAQAERTGEHEIAAAYGRNVLRHRPHGVMVVLGPYNFPGHLPNGHIVPALLAGNSVVFKPSEETPLTGQIMAQAWADAGLPEGVFTLVQGGRETGAALVGGDIDGLLFTGSAAAGAHFRRLFADRPEIMLALELGGNNPLIAWDSDPAAAASIIVQSAFITTGQRCTCARRLILPQGRAGDAILDAVVALTDRLAIGAWDEAPEPFMGPLISARAAAGAQARLSELLASGVREIRRFEPVAGHSGVFVRPGILDAEGVTLPDEEIFAPILRVLRAADFDAAIELANATAFGLAGGLVSGDDGLWRRYLSRARAGILNRNRPITGASATMPFGGVGASGNHRPAAFYAADSCAYPVASLEADAPVDVTAEMKGVRPA